MKEGGAPQSGGIEAQQISKEAVSKMFHWNCGDEQRFGRDYCSYRRE